VRPSPDGLATLVSSMPSWPAAVFILSTAAGIPPSCMASACAASLPDAKQQGVQQQPDRVLPARPDPDPAPDLVGVVLRAHHRGGRIQLTSHHPRQQQLDQRRGSLPGMRSPGCQHHARVQVLQHPRRVGQIGRQRRGAGWQYVAALAMRCPPVGTVGSGTGVGETCPGTAARSVTAGGGTIWSGQATTGIGVAALAATGMPIRPTTASAQAIAVLRTATRTLAG